MMRLFVLVATAALAISSCSREPAVTVSFAPYSKEAFDAAGAKGEPVVVLGTAEWCPPCRALHHGALADAGVKAAFDALTRLEIDGTSRSASLNPLFEAHRIDALPTLVFYDGGGREIARFEGNQSSSTLIEAARKAAAAR